MYHTNCGKLVSRKQLGQLNLPYAHYAQIGYYEAIADARSQVPSDWRIIGELELPGGIPPLNSIRIGQVRVHPGDPDYALFVVPQ